MIGIVSSSILDSYYAESVAHDSWGTGGRALFYALMLKRDQTASNRLRNKKEKAESLTTHITASTSSPITSALILLN